MGETSVCHFVPEKCPLRDTITASYRAGLPYYWLTAERLPSLGHLLNGHLRLEFPPPRPGEGTHTEELILRVKSYKTQSCSCVSNRGWVKSPIYLVSFVILGRLRRPIVQEEMICLCCIQSPFFSVSGNNLKLF